MADHAKTRRRAERVPGLGSLRLRSDPQSPRSPEFALHYVRNAPEKSGPARLPVVVLPGGPGLASALPYATFRKRAVACALDVIMVEHRGVGLSRRDVAGRDLPPEAMRIEFVVDDLAAILAAERIDKAVIVGSSYGTYLAQAFASTHPDRVAGLVLDSPVFTAPSRLRAREHIRALLYDGSTGAPETRELAAQVRALVDAGDTDELTLGNAVRITYEFAGPRVLGRLLDQLADGQAELTRRLLRRGGTADITKALPYYLEFDLVGEIAFRQLGYGAQPDGRIFDESQLFLPLQPEYSPYVGEPYDLESDLGAFDFPVVVLSGDRDLRTPRPVAESIVDIAPHGRLIPLDDTGHSALDTHVRPLLAAADSLASCRPVDVDRAAGQRRFGGPSRHLGKVISAALRIDRARHRVTGRRFRKRLPDPAKRPR